MPTVDSNELVGTLVRCFSKHGFSDKSAAAIATHLVDAEAKGMASHGLLRVPYYLELIRSGAVDPAAIPTVRSRKKSITIVDGNGGLGIPAFELALDLGIEAARKQHCAAIGVVNCGHTGRLGAYVERAAANGLFAMALGGGGSGKDWCKVVPHGGSKPVMSTNPYALGMPSRDFGPVYVDFATSAIAEGRVKASLVKKQTVPPGSIMDADGMPTVKPQDFYSGGALLPAAGPKGSGLAIIAELVGCAMLGNPVEFNWLMVLLDVAAFENENYDEDASKFLGAVKASPPARGFEEVLLPGEWESKNAMSNDPRLEVPDQVWELVSAEF